MTAATPAPTTSNFLRACRGEPVTHTPVWLMRQAGRFQAEYRAIREKVGFLELCKTPELAAEVTVFAVRQLGVDAGIIFADILLVLEPMGLRVTFEKGDGPVIHDPIAGAGDVDRLTGEIEPASLGYVGEAIRAFKRELPTVPLIGFAGAPFTLASYAIEGGGSKQYIATKRLMYEDPGAFSALMERLSTAITRFLTMQIEAGADAVQLFDSWAGALSPSDYRRHVAPHMKRIVSTLPDGVPVITFGTGTGGFLEELAASGADVVGVDWRLDMADAARRLPGVTLQGNLDPVTLFGPVDAMRREVEAILSAARGHRGHVFNLGHGILPGTPVDHVRALVELVHELSAR